MPSRLYGTIYDVTPYWIIFYDVSLPLTLPFMLRNTCKSWALFWPHIFLPHRCFLTPQTFQAKTCCFKKWGIASKLESCQIFWSTLIGCIDPIGVTLYWITSWQCNFTFDATLHVEKVIANLGICSGPTYFFAPQMFFCPTDISGLNVLL